MYNISQHIKYTRDSEKRECRFSHCAIQTRYMLEQIIINPSLINITNLIHELSNRLKTHLIRSIRWITMWGNHIKNRGRYKSKKTIESLNKVDNTKYRHIPHPASASALKMQRGECADLM